MQRLAGATAGWGGWGGESPSEPARFPAGSWAVAANASTADVLAASAAADAPLVVVHRPGLCMDLVDWRSIVPDALVVLALSHPAEVAARTVAWQPHPAAAVDGVHGWRRCIEAAVAACAARPRCVLVDLPPRPTTAWALPSRTAWRKVLTTAIADVAATIAVASPHAADPTAAVLAQLLAPSAVTPARPLLTPSEPRLERLLDSLGLAAYPPHPTAAEGRGDGGDDRDVLSAATTLYAALKHLYADS